VSEKNEYPWLERDAHEVAGAIRPHRIHLDAGMTAWVDDAAAAVFERGLSEPLPTMSGYEIAAALRSGKAVDIRCRRKADGSEFSAWASDPEFWDRLGNSTLVVARVAGGDPQPEEDGGQWSEPTTDLHRLTAAAEAGVKLQVQGPVSRSWANAYAQTAETISYLIDRGHRYRVWIPAASPGDLAAPADSLPEGVHAAPDGTLLAKGDAVRKLPEGWQRRLRDVAAWRDDHQRADLTAWYEVRPVPPEPETERVRWQDAIGRTLPDGCEITGALPGTETPGTLFVNDGAGYAIVGATSDSDGCVSVLPLSENTEEG